MRVSTRVSNCGRACDLFASRDYFALHCSQLTLDLGCSSSPAPALQSPPTLEHVSSPCSLPGICGQGECEVSDVTKYKCNCQCRQPDSRLLSERLRNRNELPCNWCYSTVQKRRIIRGFCCEQFPNLSGCCCSLMFSTALPTCYGVINVSVVRW